MPVSTFPCDPNYRASGEQLRVPPEATGILYCDWITRQPVHGTAESKPAPVAALIARGLIKKPDKVRLGGETESLF